MTTVSPANDSFEQLETSYERLAAAIDQAGPEHEALFLAKFALALAHRLGDAEAVAACIKIALQDLPPRGDGVHAVAHRQES